MQWSNHSLRIALISFSILASLLTVAGSSSAAEPTDAKKAAGIESVVPTGEGSATELLIKLSAPAAYTSYKTTAPLRLIIDFSQITQGNIIAPIVVNRGNFKKVTASRFDTDAGVLTRLEIELVSDREALIYESPASPGELKISFAEVADVVEPAPAATVAPADALPIVPAPQAAVPEVPPAAGNEPTFRVLNAITVSNNKITLALDGAISDFKTFRLNKPERYVIDLMNVRSGLPTRLLPLNASGVATARIGLYPDKVRVVLDAVNGSFPEAAAVKSDSSVVITLNASAGGETTNAMLTATRTENPVVDPAAAERAAAEKAAAESAAAERAAAEKAAAEKAAAAQASAAAMKAEPPAKAVVPVVASPVSTPAVKSAAKPAEQPETAPLPARAAAKPVAAVGKVKKPGAPASVEMIDFQVIDGISRVSVKVTGDISADQPVKTAGYVTLTIKNSHLPKQLQRSLETRSFVSPVLRVTPLTVKNKRGNDTKIRIATRVAATFEYRQEGDMLYVDFKHPEGLAGNKLIIEATEQKSKPALPKQSVTRDDEMTGDLTPAPEETGKPAGNSRQYRGRKVTLEFADAEVRKIFQLLAEVSNKNFVLGDEVTGAISLKLVNVPWDQALDIILDTKGLDKREDGSIILIKGKGKFKSQAEEDLEIRKTAAKTIELKTETFSVNYADLAAITSQFEKLKTPDRGQIASDTRTSKIIVKDTPQALSDMRSMLSQLDLPEKQVMIEARIVEATSTFSRNLGVNWGLHSRDGSAAILGINALDSGFGGLVSTSPPASGTGTSAGVSTGISFGTLASNVKLDMRLSAAASAGMIKIISSPKVATLNHKSAKISQGQSIPYTSSTANNVETKFVAATLSLDVTPHINSNGTIIMKIDAKNDFPGTGNPPPINTKQATTEMLLRDGETTVIGGIFVDSDQDTDEGVPYLMEIPLLGNLFKSNSKVKTKTELLIFITPRILGTI